MLEMNTRPGHLFYLKAGAVEEKESQTVVYWLGRTERFLDVEREDQDGTCAAARCARDMFWSVMPGEFPSPLRGGKVSTSKKPEHPIVPTSNSRPSAEGHLRHKRKHSQEATTSLQEGGELP
jgi:hypothetical protein